MPTKPVKIAIYYFTTSQKNIKTMKPNIKELCNLEF